MDCFVVVGFRPQKGTTMAIVWQATLTDELIAHLDEPVKQELRRNLDKAVQAVCDDYQVGKEYNHEL